VNNRDIPNLEKLAFKALMQSGLFNIELPGDTSPEYQETVQGLLEHKIYAEILPQAVIDDNRETVREILNSNPELLLIPLPKNCIIESQHTWQRFDLSGETLLSIAAKRHQLEMIKILWPCFDWCEQTDEVMAEKEAALACWNAYEFETDERGNNRINIPEEYANLIQELVNVFSQETFPNGSKQHGHGQLSVETEAALENFFNRLLPEEATRLNAYLDPELLLYAAYAGYFNNFDTFQNEEQQNAFCIRVIGLAQSVLSPETAKIFCEGLYNVINKKITDRAASLKLRGGESFYRAVREPLMGLGFDHLIGSSHYGPVVARVACARSAGRDGARFWNHYVKQKLQACRTYAATRPESEIVCNFMR
jgi:hypothetical protein